jgi:peptide/nickel transport system substrate-binding protein
MMLVAASLLRGLAVLLVWFGLMAGPARAHEDLVIGLSSFPTQMHPEINPEAVKAYIEGFALRPLTAFDKSWTLTCLFCAELPTLKNGLVRIEDRPGGKPGHERGMAVTVKLKPDLFWGDGVRVTTRDLAFTAKVGRDPNSGFANSRTWGRVDRVEVIDDLTAVMHLDEVSTLYDRIGTLLPEHIEGPVYAAAATPGDYINRSVYNRAPTTPGLWNGPYLVSEVTGGSTVVLTRNPYWAGHKPFFKRIVFRTVENTAALMANLQSGDVDMTPGEGMGLTIDQVLALSKSEPDRFDYIFKPALTYDHIDVQLDNPILADLRVRRAMLYAIDRKTMTQRLFDGKWPIADSWVSPLEHSYTSDVRHYPYDPARARALLAEAGWKPGDDGICRNAAGERLSFPFSVTSGVRLRELMQQVIQSQWKSACIEAQIRNEPPRLLFGETLKKRSFTGVVLYSWLSPVESSPRQTLGSDQVPTAGNNWSGTNYMDWHNKVVDEGIHVVETELDPAKRQVAWAAMQKAYAEELPVLPLFFRVEGHALPKWLKGYVPTGHNDYAVYWSEYWRAD